jgi:TolB protein
MAFARDYPQGESAILVANADGGEERKLAVRQSPEFFSSAAWSPDGKKLACVGYGRDRDGSYGDLVEIGVDGGEQKPITDRRWGGIDEVVWLSGGSGLMMSASEKTDSSNLLWLISYPGGDLRRVTTDLSNYWELSVTKDSTILVTTLRERVSDTNLYIQAGDAGTPAKLTSGSARMDGWSGISWTPDGKIVYSSEASGNSEIWIMDPDGGNQKQLTVDLGSNTRGLSVSPDGRYIVFVSKRAGGPQVWRVDVDGSNPKQLTNGAGAFNPFISPDGKWVFYFDGADTPRASKVSIDGGEPVELTSPLSDIVPRGFSPDGKLLAYKLSGVPPGRKGIGIASAEDGKPIKIVDLPRNIQWTPNQQSITYADFRDGAWNLWLLPLDGRPSKQLTNFKDKEGRMQNFAWSRDGEYLVFNRTFQASDIVLINSVK